MNELAIKKTDTLTPFKPGQSGNPAGRKPLAGNSIRRFISKLQDTPPEELEVIAYVKAKNRNPMKVMAARELLEGMGADIADYEPIIRGEISLQQARRIGINTRLIKRFKKNENGSFEIELRDESAARTRIIEQTAGKPKEIIEVKSTPTGEATRLLFDAVARQLKWNVKPAEQSDIVDGEIVDAPSESADRTDPADADPA